VEPRQDAGIYLPTEVRFRVSEDGRQFTAAATASPTLAAGAPGPEVSILRADGVVARGRWVRVVAVNVGTVPPACVAAGTKAWLFADEVIVDPETTQ
jgi:hexosaminidase